MILYLLACLLLLTLLLGVAIGVAVMGWIVERAVFGPAEK